MNDLVEQARRFAAHKHADQKRKHGGEPYLAHLESVAGILAEHGFDSPTIQAAALLHDTIEKTDATLDELVETFGNDVAELVYWMTDSEKGNPALRTLVSSWRLSRAPIGAKLIKLADILDNVSHADQHDPEAAAEYRADEKCIVDKMAQMEGQTFMDLPLLRSVAAAVRPTPEGSARKQAS